MRRAILQRFVNLLVARMLADEHPDSSLRHLGIREAVVAGEGGGTQGDAGDFKDMSKKDTYLEKYLELVVGAR